MPPRVAHALRPACAAPCARLAACALVAPAVCWRVGVARRAAPPRRQRPRGRGRGPWRLLEEESGLLADVLATASWRPSRAPPVAAVLWRAPPARFSRVSVVGRAAPLRGQRHERR